MEEDKTPINEGAIYIVINNIYIDCRDISRMDLLGYAPNKQGQPDQTKPVYRIIFNDNSYMEASVPKDALHIFNKSKESNTFSGVDEE